MRAGKLDRVINVENKYREYQLGGRVEDAFFSRATCRAEIISEMNAQSAGDVATKYLVRIRMRFMKLNFDDRIRLDGKQFEIASIAEIGRREAMEVELVRVG